jgi:hypothetical protein
MGNALLALLTTLVVLHVLTRDQEAVVLDRQVLAQEQA